MEQNQPLICIDNKFCIILSSKHLYLSLIHIFRDFNIETAWSAICKNELEYKGREMCIRDSLYPHVGWSAANF